jgi:hypothetical protein
MIDPLAGFPWRSLHQLYDDQTRSDFDKALRRLPAKVADHKRFVPHATDRLHYYWLLAEARQRPVEINVYAALCFWKLYSTAPKTCRWLMTEADERQRAELGLRRLDGLLPATVGRDVDHVIQIVEAIGPLGIYGMKSGLAVRTALVHILFPDVVPIFDQMVLRAVGVPRSEALGRVGESNTLREYVLHVWTLVDRHRARLPVNVKETPVRLIEMALWLRRDTKG